MSYHDDDRDDDFGYEDAPRIRFANPGSALRADAPWRDLYEETDGEADEAAIVETLAEYDDTFAAMVELGAPGDIL